MQPRTRDCCGTATTATKDNNKVTVVATPALLTLPPGGRQREGHAHCRQGKELHGDGKRGVLLVPLGALRDVDQHCC